MLIYDRLKFITEGSQDSNSRRKLDPDTVAETMRIHCLLA